MKTTLKTVARKMIMTGRNKATGHIFSLLDFEMFHFARKILCKIVNHFWW